MATVTQQERDDVFKVLVQNGLDFIKRSASELKTDQKFAIAHFATGLELILKARLFAEHWALILHPTPSRWEWNDLKSGTATTIQASSLCITLEKITGCKMKEEEKKTFGQVFDHRNRTLHWIPHEDLAEATAEQCRAWHALFRLLTVQWKSVFKDFRAEIRDVERTLRVHTEYMRARFESVQPQIRGLSEAGKIAQCPVCRLEALQVVAPDEVITPGVCLVCEMAYVMGHFECGAWIALTDLPKDCSSCGTEHCKGELAWLLSPDAQNNSESPHCGECFGRPSNVFDLDGEEYRCLDCGADFARDELRACDYCGVPWIGYNTENTAAHGCEFCPGHSAFSNW